MVRINSPSSSNSILPPAPPAETAAPHGHLDYLNHSPPPPPHRQGHGHGHGHHHLFGRPAFGEAMVSLLPAHDSAAPHPFMSGTHSPPPPPPFHGHDHGYSQQFGPPPPPSRGNDPQQFDRPALQEPMPFLPPAHESEVLLHGHGHDHGHPQQFGSSPPPPPPRRHRHPPPPSHGHPQQLGRPALHESILPPPPTHESEAPHPFSSGNQSPPSLPPSHGRHHPPPSSHGHHPSHQVGKPHAFHEVMLSPPPDLEPAASLHMFMSHKHSPPPLPPPPPHLDHYNHSHSPPSPLHSYGGAFHHTRQVGRPPAVEIEAPLWFDDPFQRSHSHSPPLPPRPPHRHYRHSFPFHGFEHRYHAAKFGMHPPMEPPEADHYEPFTSGMGPHPPNQFSGHQEGMSDWLPSEEEHPPPNHETGGGHHVDDINLGGHSYMPHEMGGAHHPHELGGARHGRHSPPHLRSPPPKHTGRSVAPPAYLPFCAPLVPAAHFSNGPLLAVPVW